MMKLSSIALAWVSLALPALAQDVTLTCATPLATIVWECLPATPVPTAKIARQGVELTIGG